jgi:Trypsin-co-occurring domain 2
MERIGLKEAIGALRSELSESILAAADEDLQFQVPDVSMEFQVELEKSAGGSGGIKFWVVELGGEASRTSTVTHSLSLSLKPVTADGKPVLTGGRSVPD